jgi:ParB-like chromosome segregation protein Spo0J
LGCPLPARYLETVYVDPSELHPYPGNPNQGDIELVRGSVRANGQYRSVIARQLPDGTLELLAGHTTTEATGVELGKTRVEVIDADDATARRIVAADNQTARKAEMDEAALFALLKAAEVDGGLDGTGFVGEDLDDLAKLLEAPDLDALAGQVGEPTDADRRMVVRVSADPDAKDRFERLMTLTQEPEEADAFAGVVAWAATAARGEGLDVEP